MKVNMTPNPLDVVTIHASQGDSEARQWEFELHNNGELIDTSEITEQMVFKSYKGGTEQILPENGSTPTTSPFKGDIKYPQGLLTDQEFTYRQSPTEEDGNAKITDIKGNTIKWNQLANISDSSFTNRGITVTRANGKISYSGTTMAGSSPYIDVTNSFIDLSKIIAGHKYLISVHDSADGGGRNRRTHIVINNPYTEIPVLSQTASRTIIFTPNATPTYALLRITIGTEEGVSLNGTASVIIVDLTQMGFDSLTEDEFTSLFPLSYYSYNQGSLLSFNGNGIKTVGKNLFDGNWESGSIGSGGANIASDTSIRTFGGVSAFFFEEGKTYTFSCEGVRSEIWVNYYFKDNSFQRVQLGSNIASGTFTVPSGVSYIRFRMTKTSNDLNPKAQAEIGTTATAYEPYASSTLSLPISTYFSNGMNGHGDTYDELTSAVATKRFEKDSLGDLTWTRRTTNIFSANLPSKFDASKNISCFMSNRLPTVFVSGYTLAEDGYISIYKISAETPSTSIYLNMASQSIDTVADLKTWLSNNSTELVYPLATPTETSFTTASLVTENAEIPLSNEDGVLIGKCTEQLSENPGFIDAKIKLSDADGECYSNKIQLHVERSPQ